MRRGGPLATNTEFLPGGGSPLGTTEIRGASEGPQNNHIDFQHDSLLEIKCTHCQRPITVPRQKKAPLVSSFFIQELLYKYAV